MERKLPTPINGSEEYLRAIYEELQGLRADVQRLGATIAPSQPAQADDGTIALKEPAQPAPAKRKRQGG